MSQEWYDYPVTQAHGNGETGIDLGTPNDTPVYFPWNCTVIDASYQTYGGQVACAVDGQNISTYFIHLDQIYVKTGDQVNAGDVIGLTGGGIGDNLLHDGTVQPAQSQSWFVDSDGSQASTGYHTEFGEFIASNMQQFNQDWYNTKNQIDPTDTITQLMQGGIGGAVPPTKDCIIPLWCSGLPTPIEAILPQCNCGGANPTKTIVTQGSSVVGTSLFGGESGISRVLFAVLGGTLVILGLVGLVHGDTIIETVANPVGTLVKGK